MDSLAVFGFQMNLRGRGNVVLRQITLLKISEFPCSTRNSSNLPARMCEASIRNKCIKKGKRFRKRLRAPYCMFEETYASFHDEGCCQDRKCKNGWPKVEVEILVLYFLHLLESVRFG